MNIMQEIMKKYAIPVITIHLGTKCLVLHDCQVVYDAYIVDRILHGKDICTYSESYYRCNSVKLTETQLSERSCHDIQNSFLHSLGIKLRHKLNVKKCKKSDQIYETLIFHLALLWKSSVHLLQLCRYIKLKCFSS